MLPNLTSGSYTLTAQYYGYTLTPEFSNPVSVGPDRTGLNFGGRTTPIIAITQTPDDGWIEVAEGGGPDTYTVRFSSQPTHDILFAPSYNTNQLMISPTGITVNAANFDQSFLFTVWAVDDADLENTPDFQTVDHLVTTLDPGYANASNLSFDARIIDNETNRPPVANDDWEVTVEDLAISRNYLTNDFDLDGNWNGFIAFPWRPPSNGSYSISFPPNIIYTPNSNFYGVDNFTYRIYDNDGASDTATVWIVVQQDANQDLIADDPNSDTDGDQMPDIWELPNGLNPLIYNPDNDEDGDRAGNLHEYISGTDPLDPASLLQVVITRPHSSISWSSVVGRVYAVERSPHLITAPWTTIASNIPGSNTWITLNDTNTSERANYRIRVEIP
ncbi:MAG: Ig-like domain-containing protein [Verrucomicrobiota bacterium]